MTVDGVDSTWTVRQLSVELGGTLDITNGGRVTATSSNSGSLIAGSATVSGNNSRLITTAPLTVNIGELRVENSGGVSNTFGSIRSVGAFQGHATVTGLGSTWTNSDDLYVGESGTGFLVIADGGTVIADDSYVGKEAGSEGTVTVTGSGSHWNHSVDLFVGNLGTGTLTIESGGTVTNKSGYIGREIGSQGAVAVTGAGSTWAHSAALGTGLFVGYSGEGDLTIEDGGAVSAQGIRIGFEAGSQGTATVTGNGSTSTSFSFSVGFRGSGELTIADGAAVTAEQSFIGFFDDAEGTATITGAGSNWTTTGSGSFSFLSVGSEATGELLIENGGSANSEVGYIGHFDGAQGSATITGAGSVWTTTVNLTLGGNSMGPTTAVGTLTLNEGGKVDVGGTLQLYANGTLTGSGGIVDGNVNNAGEVAPGNSAGVLTIDGDYTQEPAGKLTIELGGIIPETEHDQLVITGSATLDGILEVVLLNDFMPTAGQVFDILNWASVSGEFLPPQLPPLDDGLIWNTDLLYTQGVLQVVLPGVLSGDYNDDGAVDAADYVVWRKNVGAPAGTLPNDIDGGTIGPTQYNTWRAHFGQTSFGSGSLVDDTGAVPEPSALLLAVLSSLMFAAGRPRESVRSSLNFRSPL